MNAPDPVASRLVGQLGGAIVHLAEAITRLEALRKVFDDAIEEVAPAPGVDRKAALILEAALRGEVEALEAVRAPLLEVRLQLARAARNDAAGFSRALRA
ncbi:MAG: hypothetical protein K8R60_04495 [Burkholderiales bacterium]|nr:hypothetical protein [Burkholderiales bacterium]